MEGKGSIAATIEDTSHADKHPGTMNFRRRLKEAQRIHDSNMLLASRLDTIEPHYRKADLSIVVPTKTRAVTSEGKPYY